MAKSDACDYAHADDETWRDPRIDELTRLLTDCSEDFNQRLLDYLKELLRTSTAMTSVLLCGFYGPG